MANRDVQMDSWIKRCRSFAEGVVVMVSPVLLAFALTKVNLTLKEHGRILPIAMLVVAAATLISGIGPFLAFSLSKFWITPNQMPRPPHTVTKSLAPICSAFLVVLACWIMSLIIYNNKAVYSVPGALIGLCIIVRSVQYWRQEYPGQPEAQRYYNKLENSLECLAGITAFLFLGLESLALESYISAKEDAQRRLTAPMATSFYACVAGVISMLLATTPPSWFSIDTLTAVFDVAVGAAVFLAMFFIMYAVMKLRAFIVMGPGLLIFLVHVLYVAVSSSNDAHNGGDEEQGRGGNNGTVNNGAEQERGGNPGEVNNGAEQERGRNNGTVNNGAEQERDGNPGEVRNGAEQDEPPASLELIKVTFVGFLAVSIPSISDNSVDRSSEWFVHLAAAAIVSGLMWRLLTHLKSDGRVEVAVNLASVVTHSFILAATVPFAIMAGKALPATATAPAPAPVP